MSMSGTENVVKLWRMLFIKNLTKFVDSSLYILFHMQIKDGDVVKIIDDLELLREYQKNHGGCNEEMEQVFYYFCSYIATFEHEISGIN